jgi:hypothetical protein
LNGNVNINYASRLAQTKQACQAESFKFATREELEFHIDMMSEQDRELFGYLLLLGNAFPRLFPRQMTMSKRGGYKCRATSNRRAKKWHEQGLIQKVYRHRHSCLYVLNPIFFDPEFRKKYSAKFKAFKTFALIYLFALGLGHVYGSVTPNSPVVRLLNESVSVRVYKVNKYTDSKRRAFNMYATEKQKKLIDSIANKIGLTERGRAGLTPYPEECLQSLSDDIDYAIRKEKYTGWRDPWKIFMYFCRTWCESNNVRANFAAENDAIAAKGLKQEDPRMHEGWQGFIEQDKTLKKAAGLPQKTQQRESTRASIPQTQPKAWEKPVKQTFLPAWKVRPEAALRNGDKQGYETNMAMGEPLDYDQPKNIAMAQDSMKAFFSPDQIAAMADRFSQETGTEKIVSILRSTINDQHLAKSEGEAKVAQTTSVVVGAFGDGSPIADYAAYDDGQNNDEVDHYQTI